MQSLRTVLDSEELNNIITLPSDFEHKKVEVIIHLVSEDNTISESNQVFTSESFGMWKDRKDMDDVESYVRNMRKGRKLC
ncbi:hypothetical protein FACS1894110_24070 [Spirochaetia bacterium]|nr:hypothetical protein FACS1894110_24070 [Spirochaetia bacterium]